MTILGDLMKFQEWFDSWKDKQTTEPEKELLKKALENKGEIRVLESDQSGEFIRIGRDVLANDKEPSVQAIYLEALRKLIKRGFVEPPKSGILFRLSGSGFEEEKKPMNKKE